MVVTALYKLVVEVVFYFVFPCSLFCEHFAEEVALVQRDIVAQFVSEHSQLLLEDKQPVGFSKHFFDDRVLVMDLARVALVRNIQAVSLGAKWSRAENSGDCCEVQK